MRTQLHRARGKAALGSALAAGLLALVAPGVALGATASTASDTVVYTAGDRELNVLRIRLVNVQDEGERLELQEWGDMTDGTTAITVVAVEPCRGGTGGLGRRRTESGGAAHPTPVIVDCPKLARIRVDLGDQNDSLSIAERSFQGVALVTDDVLDGGLGSDFIFAGQGSDILNGGDDDDHLGGGPGPDVMNGGAGSDTARYDDAVLRSAGVVADIGGGANDGSDLDGPPGARDTIQADVENLVGSAWDDRLTGDGGANRVAGGPGSDVVAGAGGDDHLLGDVGSDVVNGGAGNDHIDIKDNSADHASCGEGADRVTADANDTFDADCETIERPTDGTGPPLGGSESPSSPGSAGSTGARATGRGPSLAIARRARLGSRRTIVVGVTCRPPTRARCTGVLRLMTQPRGVKLGAQIFRTPAGRRGLVRLPLSTRHWRLLSRARSVRLRAEVLAFAGRGRASRATANLTLR